MESIYLEARNGAGLNRAGRSARDYVAYGSHSSVAVARR